MKSYLNNQKLKTDTIEKLKVCIENKILKRDNISAGEYGGGTIWENGKGNVMGCVSESDDMATIAGMYGFPQQLMAIQNRIFQMLSKKKGQKFGLDFLEAVPIGVDLHPVWKKYYIWLFMEGSLIGRLGHIELAKIAIEKAVDTLRRSLAADIPKKEIEGIVKELNSYRRIVGQAADAGAVEPYLAGVMLASTHYAVEACVNPDFFVEMSLPPTDSAKVWKLLAARFIELLKSEGITNPDERQPT